MDGEVGQNAALGSPDESEEISKKDLLQETALSYGQFYRWKRMGLIPEAWFRRRSTFTGHETFLPRQKVLERLRQIQELKDRYSLEEIALMLSPDASSKIFARSELAQLPWFSPQVWRLFPASMDPDEIHFPDLLCLALIGKLLERGLTDELIKETVRTFLRNFHELPEAAPERSLVVLEKHGANIILLHSGNCVFDEGTVIVETINLNLLVEEVKVRIQKAKD